MTMDTAQIRAILGDAVQDGGWCLQQEKRNAADVNWRIEWWPAHATADLHGSFTADELFAIAAHMRAQGG